MKRIVLTIRISLFTFSFLFSQNTLLTYEEAISIALENNISFKQQQNNLKVSKAEKQHSLANFLPSVGAGGSGYRTDGRQWSNEESAMVNTSIDRANYSIGADMTIFNGFKNIYQFKQANQLKLAQEQLVDESAQYVVFQASRQFLQVLLDKELLLISEKDYEVQKKLFEQVEVYVKIGTKTSADLFSQEAQLKTSEVDLITRKNQLRSDKLILSTTLLLEPGKEFDLISPDWDNEKVLLEDYNFDSLLQIAFNSRPDMQRLKAEENAALQRMRISRTNYLPRVSIFYNYGSYYASNNRRLNTDDSLYTIIPFNDQLIKENYSHQYGFNINIPIFSKFQNHTQFVTSKIAYENAILASKEIEIQIYSGVQNAYQDFISYKEKYKASIASAEAANRSYQRQNESYLMGQGSLVELNIESQRNIKAQSEKVQAEYNLLFQQIIINYYIGVLKSEPM